MKFGKIGTVGKVTLVCGLALSVATLFSACGTLTVGFLYVATTKQTPGQIEVYEVNSEAGSLRTIPTSPFPSGGRNPIAEAVSTDFANLYVVNGDDNNITQFGIGNDGKLYAQSTINTPGTFPMAEAVNPANPFLYVVDTLQPVPGCTLTNPCPGAVAGYAIQPTKSANDPGALGVGPSGCSATPSSTQTQCTNGNAILNSNGLSYVPLQLSALDTTVLTPTGIAITANGSYAYVSAYNPSNNQGYIFAFLIGTDGSLSAVSSGVNYTFNGQQVAQVPFSAGSEPSALIGDTTGAYLYVVDRINNQISTYTVQSSGTIALASSVATGGQPSAVTQSSAGFVYVTNSLDGTVTGYNASSGTLTNFGTYDAGTQPVAVIGDPRKLGFLYTVNFLGNSVSGYQVNSSTGALVNTKASPYISSVQPTAIVGIPHDGNAH